MNSRDPLRNNPDAAVELFKQFGKLASGFSHDDAINAAANIVINALRQQHHTRSYAEAAWDEVMARAKGQLMECYDSTGRKKGVFPYPQTIVMSPIKLKS